MGSKGMLARLVVALPRVAVWCTSRLQPSEETPAVEQPGVVALAAPAESVPGSGPLAADPPADAGASPLEASDDAITVTVPTRLAPPDRGPAMPIAARIEPGVSSGYQVAARPSRPPPDDGARCAASWGGRGGELCPAPGRLRAARPLFH